MNNMKKLIGVVVSIVFAVLTVGCGRLSPLAPTSNTVPAGVYFISQVGGQSCTQQAVVISDGIKVRLGKVATYTYPEIESAKPTGNGDSINVTLKDDMGDFLPTVAIRVPLSVSNWGASDSLHPFNGLYASLSNDHIFAVSADSIFVLTPTARGWLMEVKGLHTVQGIGTASAVLNFPAGNMGKKLEFDPNNPLPPYQNGILNYVVPATQGQSQEQIINLD